MASGWSPTALTAEEVQDGEAYHRALYHDGDLARPTSWHADSVNHLLDLIQPYISEGALVVDYGSGTGGSAIELLKRLDAAGITIELVMVDPLVSWFSKAHEILSHRTDVHFELSTKIGDNGRPTFRTMNDILGGRKANAIISASTLHLVPEKALPDLGRQFAQSLAEDGVFAWNSGDIHSSDKPDSAALLHDPYRMVRERLRADNLRITRLGEMENEAASKFEKKVDRIFPQPYSIELILDAFAGAGLTTDLTTHVVNFDAADAERFILVPRLAEIAAPLHEGDERDTAVKDAINQVLSYMQAEGTADSESYRSYWVYGCHTLG